MRNVQKSLYSACLGLTICLFIARVEAADSTRAPSDPSVIHVPAFDLPVSSLLSPETRAALERVRQERAARGTLCPLKWPGASAEEIKASRACAEKHLYPPLLAPFHSRYAVAIERKILGGVATEIFTPKAGVSAAHADKVLINLHGGSFMAGGRWGGQIESIPISAVGGFKVVSIDYRLAPEFKYPAASEDVEAVYRQLLKTYPPENIGLYGCSAGGELAGQAVAWLQSKGLPRPGAVGMFCAAASFWGEGDSAHLFAAWAGYPAAAFVDFRKIPYLEDVDLNDPIAFPIRSRAIMARFPPSLLIASTRDQALSSVAHTHSVLVALGVEADLHVWEGLDHGFFSNPDLPESREVYEVVAKFFARHLGLREAK